LGNKSANTSPYGEVNHNNQTYKQKSFNQYF